MLLNERIAVLALLGDYLKNDHDEALEAVIEQSFQENKWFTPANQKAALSAIATQMLDKKKLTEWANYYSIADNDYPTKTVGIVMAGNLPLVGFFDWLCVFVSGQKAAVKLSEKDKRLLPFLVKKLGEWHFETWIYTQFVERLTDFQAVIATGSNNTGRYFEQYFASVPHLIRGNRNSVAVLDGSETRADLDALGLDIFSFFGLGCRNVSKILVPVGYDFNPFMEATHEFNDLANHDKWRNNFDYNTTLFLLNRMPYLNNGCLVIREDPSMQSRISCVHYEFYENSEKLIETLEKSRTEIQCVVSKNELPGFKKIGFGETQKPGLSDYPDEVDVMAFLN